jgi:hypothetical protein
MPSSALVLQLQLKAAARLKELIAAPHGSKTEARFLFRASARKIVCRGWKETSTWPSAEGAARLLAAEGSGTADAVADELHAAAVAAAVAEANEADAAEAGAAAAAAPLAAAVEAAAAEPPPVPCARTAKRTRDRAADIFISEQRAVLRGRAEAQKRATGSTQRVSQIIKTLGSRQFLALPAEERNLWLAKAEHQPLHRSRTVSGQYVRDQDDAPLIALVANEPRTPLKERPTLTIAKLARIGKSCLDELDKEMATPIGKGDSAECRYARRKLKDVKVHILKNAGLTRASASKASDGPSISGHLWKHGCSAERKVVVRTPKLNADQIIAQMTPYVKESSRYSGRCKRRFKQLCGSIARAHRKAGVLKEAYAYSTLAKKLRPTNKKSLGICRGKRKSDDCSVCVQWDCHVTKKLYTQVDEIRECLDSQRAGFFDGWNRGFDLTSVFDDCDPTYFADLSTFINDRALEEPDDAALGVAVASATVSLDECTNIVKDFGCHFQLRDTLKGALRRDMDDPQASIIYTYEDFEVTGFY